MSIRVALQTTYTVESRAPYLLLLILKQRYKNLGLEGQHPTVEPHPYLLLITRCALSIRSFSGWLVEKLVEVPHDNF